MRKKLAKYLLYIYLTFIKDKDEEIYKKWAVPIIKSVIFVRGIYFWILSILFFPVFLSGMIIEDNKEEIIKKLNIEEINNFI